MGAKCCGIHWAKKIKEHFGIVVSNEIPQGELKRRVTKLLESVTAEDLKACATTSTWRLSILRKRQNRKDSVPPAHGKIPTCNGYGTIPGLRKLLDPSQHNKDLRDFRNLGGLFFHVVASGALRHEAISS
jgi:hypothetical protein